MTNLDKILDRIRTDGDERAARILSETDEEIARLAAESEKETAANVAAVDEAARRDAQKIVTLARSAAAAQRKKRVLEAKSRALDEAVEQAERSLAALPEEEYVGLVLTLIDRGTDDTPGTVYLAEGRPVADRAGFAYALARLPGKNLSLADETAPLATGVLVSYGRIQADLSFGAVLADKKDAVRDRLNDLIFRDAAKE